MQLLILNMHCESNIDFQNKIIFVLFFTQSCSPTRQTALRQLKMYTSKYPSSQKDLNTTINGVCNSFLTCNMKSPNVTVGNAVYPRPHTLSLFFTISFYKLIYSSYHDYKISNNLLTLFQHPAIQGQVSLT